MASTEQPRDRRQRVADTLTHLEQDSDLWVSTASDGRPWLVPLSFHWTGELILLATSRQSWTYRNIVAGGGARIALGPTRDVVMLDGDVALPEQVPSEDADAVAAATGVDPRSDEEAGYISFMPVRAQAWRTVEELQGRTIMRDGAWVED